MRLRQPFAMVLAVVSLLVGAATGAAAGTTGTGPALQPRVLTTFPPEELPPWGGFAESVAVSRGGDLFVSVTQFTEEPANTGQVWRVTTTGVRTAFGPRLDVVLITGLAFDDRGVLYAGVVGNADAAVQSGVVRIGARSATWVLRLPEGSFPNGLAFRGRDLYVSDSTTGSVWRTRPHGDALDLPTAPWLTAAVLAPSVGWEGVNGIAFLGDRLVGVVADTGLVVSTNLRPDGSAGPVRTVAAAPSLVNADGISFDATGTLWVCVNSSGGVGEGSLVTVSPRGTVRAVVTNPSWLDYPSQAAFGTTPATRTTLFVANGALYSDRSVSDVVALRVGVRGLPLPQ